MIVGTVIYVSLKMDSWKTFNERRNDKKRSNADKGRNDDRDGFEGIDLKE